MKDAVLSIYIVRIKVYIVFSLNVKPEVVHYFNCKCNDKDYHQSQEIGSSSIDRKPK